MRRTKIVCTIGPSTSTEEKVAALVEAGMDAARLNFSHGTREDHAAHIARIRRVWKKGDTIDVVFPLDPRRVVAHEAVKDDDGKVAVERGPIVYCAEGHDNGGGVLNLALPDDAPLISEWRPELLKGIVVLKGKALAAARNDDGSAAPPKEQPLVLIPYYAWAHRGPGEMAVWLPRK